MQLSELGHDIDEFLNNMKRRSALKSFRGNGISRISFYEKISSFLAAGVPIMKILDAIVTQKKRKKKYKSNGDYIVMSDIIQKMSSGARFSDALRDLVPAEEYLLISAGEKSGSLPKNIELCTLTIRDSAEINASVRGAITTPFIYIAMLLGLFYALGEGMLPTLEDVAPVSDWSASGQSLHALSTFIVNYIFVIIVTVISLVVGLIYALPNLKADFRYDYLDNINPFKMYRTIQSTFFLLALGALLSSGIKTSESLTFLHANAKPYAKKHIEQMIARLSSGAKASEVIATRFLGDSADDIELYGLSGQFDEALINTANHSKVRTKKAIESFSSIFGGVMFGIIGLSAVWGISSFLSISSSIAASQAN